MRLSGAIYTHVRGDHHKDAGAARGLVQFLRKRHPHKTAASVAAETGISERVIEKWLSGEVQSPAYSATIRLIYVYGPSLLSAAIAELMPDQPSWLDDVRRAELQKQLERQIAELHSTLGEIKQAERGTECRNGASSSVSGWEPVGTPPMERR